MSTTPTTTKTEIDYAELLEVFGLAEKRAITNRLGINARYYIEPGTIDIHFANAKRMRIEQDLYGDTIRVTTRGRDGRIGQRLEMPVYRPAVVADIICDLMVHLNFSN